MEVRRLPLEKVDWAFVDSFEDRIFSQRPEWLNFVNSFVDGEIVILELRQHQRSVGYFTGIRTKVMGISILGSPHRGWLTTYMGFNLKEGIDRGRALQAVERYAFEGLGCLHLEVVDRKFKDEDGLANGYTLRRLWTYQTDLTQSDDALLRDMKSACRRNLRKAERSGLVVSEASPEGFAEEFYGHVEQVFAKQGSKPPYDCARIKQMIDHVHPSGHLLLARVTKPGGLSIATGIFPGFGSMAFFWGNGSLREHHILRPNEALHWFVMRYWKARGCQVYDWSGGGQYKEKYGCKKISLFSFRKSRFKILDSGQKYAIKLYNLRRKLLRARHLKKVGTGQSPAT